MTIIFKAKTADAYHIKILAELMTNNIKTAHFEADKTGIHLRMMDHQRRILIDLSLPAENFSVYKFKPDKKMYLGINLSHFHKMLKSIKKKDSLKLYIDDNKPKELAIRVIPKEGNRVTTSFVTIQDVQELDIDVPTGYHKSVIVTSSEFQKVIKDMNTIGNTINVVARDFHVQFNCDAGGILKRVVDFGEIEDSDDDESASDASSSDFNQNFMTEQLSRITKIAGLSTQMKIFPGKPLLFRSNVGNIGEISLYIKSKEQIDMESHTIEDEEGSSDEETIGWSATKTPPIELKKRTKA